MLSRYERRRLREIEDWFETNDPSLVDYVRTAEQSSGHRQIKIVTAAATVGVLIFLLGLVLAVPSAILLGLLLGLGGFLLRSWLRRKAAEDAQRHDVL
ncbi:DUF3040 domain-containing protein [Saccharopolyspora elongata]|nr:DUF3040 domain-containing protein [Saccharopolyspora elongata]